MKDSSFRFQASNKFRRSKPQGRQAASGGFWPSRLLGIRNLKLEAFTLLEILLAVAILALVGTAIFRFTETTLVATRLAARDGETSQAIAGLTRLLQAQLDSLPATGVGVLTGDSGKDGDRERDELTLVCEGPAALLRRRAPGAWRVRIGLRSPAGGDGGVGNGKGGGTLGMQRLGPADDPTAVDANAPAGPTLLTEAATRRRDTVAAAEWVPLLDGVAGLEVNYFNARLNGWLPRWNDPNTLPNLLRVRLVFAEGGGRPQEIVLRVPPRTRPQVLAPTATPAAPGNQPPPETPPDPSAPSGDEDNGDDNEQ